MSRLAVTRIVPTIVFLLLSLQPEQLIASDNASPVDQRWRSAIMNGDTGALQKMLRASAAPREQIAVLSDTGKSALMIACKVGDLPFVRRLLDMGADEHASTATGGTAFMFASLGNHTDVVQFLHGRDVDVNAQGANGWSATTIAAAKGYSELLALLLELDVDINSRDVYQWTPLMRAVDNGHDAAVSILLDEPGLHLDGQDETGNTALHHAASNGDAMMLRLLLEAGIDQSIRNNSGFIAAQLVTALSNSAELLPLFSND